MLLSVLGGVLEGVAFRLGWSCDDADLEGDTAPGQENSARGLARNLRGHIKLQCKEHPVRKTLNKTASLRFNCQGV